MIKKNIPNAITCANLLCGCLALTRAFEGDLTATAVFVGAALVLDFLDGFTARLLKVSSAIGKDLDSLADMVTFGVVPGVVMYLMIFQNLPWTGAEELILEDQELEAGFRQVMTRDLKTFPWLPYLGFVIPLFSCIRLAKFNNDTRQSDSFIGVPTPANTMLICSLPLIAQFQPEWDLVNRLIANPWFLAGLSCLMAGLLVAELPLFALKFKSFSWAANKQVYSFLAVSLLLLLGLRFLAVPLIILLYIFISIVNNIFLKKKV